MRNGKDPKVLVAVAGTTRAWELCWDGFASNVLDELGADLALCTGDRDPRPNPFYERAKYAWSFEQPDDWADVYDRVVGDPSWRALLRPGDHLLGGVRSTEHPQPAVGALVIYMRWLLKQYLVRSGLIAKYDWLILTRSDFLWELPHPRLRHLSERRVYTFDGEHYGGISLRHLVAPRRHAERLLSLYDPVFTEPEQLRRRLDRRCTVEGWPFLNLEQFHAARLKELGFWRRLRFLPYIPYTVRAPGGLTGWSVGEFDDRLGFYVKYPAERERSEITRGLVSDRDSWGSYLAPVRGAPARRRLRRSYRERGLYERPFPLRQAPRRAYRMARWRISQLPELRRRAEIPVGRQLRRLPGASPLLDARLRRIRRRPPTP